MTAPPFCVLVYDAEDDATDLEILNMIGAGFSAADTAETLGVPLERVVLTVAADADAFPSEPLRGNGNATGNAKETMQ